jgi:hypothetical protein
MKKVSVAGLRRLASLTGFDATGMNAKEIRIALNGLQTRLKEKFGHAYLNQYGDELNEALDRAGA